MPEEVSVVVHSELVDVLAQPAEIRLSVGVGAPGQRGSLFFAGSLTPAGFFASMGQTPNIYDLYLSVSTKQMFQYVSTPSGNIWSMLFDLTPLGGITGGGSALMADPSNAGLYVISDDPLAPGSFLEMDPVYEGLYQISDDPLATPTTLIPDPTFTGLYIATT
jgi:hypothetical protein